VGRRLIGLFLLAAVLPILLTAILSYTQVSSLLVENSKQQLKSQSKTYGLSILDRLNYTDQILTDFADQIREGDKRIVDKIRHMEHYFDNLTLYTESRTQEYIGHDVINLTLTPAETNHLKEGKPLLSTLVNEEGYGSVYISILVDKKDHSKGILLGKIKPLYLWGSRDTLSYNYQYTILFNKSVVLHTTDLLPDSALENITSSLIKNSNSVMQWENQGEKYYGDSWDLYLKHRYMSPAWSIVTGQSAQQVFSPINTFQSIFPLSLLLAVLVVALFSIKSIRKTTLPLEKLIVGTQRITKQQFDNQVHVNSNDEFEQLAKSFNTMSDTLGKQFNALETLSKLDRLILSAPAPGHIIEIVIQHLSHQLRHASISVSILNDSANGESTLFMNAKGTIDGDILKRFILPREEIIKLLSNKQGFLVAMDMPIAQILIPLIGSDVSKLYVFPVIYKNRLYGTINIGLSESDEELNEDEKRQCLALSDRVSVALATSEKEEQLYRQAHFDSLTGLPNRQLMRDRFTREIMYARREDQNVAILFLDLDRFKNINDSLGHSAGDILLQQAGQRIRAVLRDTDTVARIGGDEFTIVLSNIHRPTDAGSVARDLINSMADPFVINGKTNFIGASIGIAVYPTDGEDVDELMKKADTAMYRAKDMGRNTYAFFTQDMNTEAVERISLENDLHTALDDDQFVLHFQPLMNVAKNTVESCEVLLRWNHPDHDELITPTKFIGVAEDAGLIDSIGTWVIQTACMKYRDWIKDGHSLERIAINVSGHQFSNPRFIENVHSALHQSKLPPHHVELEITESVLIYDINTSIKTLQTLHGTGVGLTLDDFGTGYSSLSYLRTFPADILKVDRSFIIDIPYDKEATAIVRMIIELAHSLGKKVVVEGIETPEQAETVRELGTDFAQGFYYSQPLSEEDFLDFIRKHNKKLA
jgi:diguanylate cyclase (GGDEF)-like protein